MVLLNKNILNFISDNRNRSHLWLQMVTSTVIMNKISCGRSDQMTRNQIEYWNLQELKRSNKARELETNRSNLARETETFRNNNLIFGANMANLAETAKSHRANETNQAIANQETSLHNRVMESLQQSQNVATLMNASTNRMNANENRRHNLATEMNQSLNSVNSSVANLLDYSIRDRQLSETQRHNLTSEGLEGQKNLIQMSTLNETKFHNRISEQETKRANLARERENIRSHKALELNNYINTGIHGYDTVVSHFLDFAKIMTSSNVLKAIGGAL